MSKFFLPLRNISGLFLSRFTLTKAVYPARAFFFSFKLSESLFYSFIPVFVGLDEPSPKLLESFPSAQGVNGRSGFSRVRLPLFNPFLPKTGLAKILSLPTLRSAMKVLLRLFKAKRSFPPFSSPICPCLPHTAPSPLVSAFKGICFRFVLL